MKARTKKHFNLWLPSCPDPGIFFRGGGGGGVQARWPEKQPGQRFYFSSQLILSLQRGSNDFKRKLYFSKDPKGVQHVPGGGGGVQVFPGGKCI